MEIGSIFSLEYKRELCNFDKPLRSSNTFNGYKSSFFSLCREAILAAIHKSGCQNKKVLIPAYTCQTVLDPFLQEGWACFYYPIDRSLRIEREAFLQLLELHNPGFVVVHPFYGMDLLEEEVQLLQIAKEMGCLVMEDLTQCILSRKMLPSVNYYVGSIRKWLGAPDGAFLRIRDNEIDTSDALPEYTAFFRPQQDAMYLRGIYFDNGDVEIKEISRRINKYAEDVGDGTLSLHRMSAFSKQCVAKADWAELERVRKSNFAFLLSHMPECANIVEPVCKDIHLLTTAPLYFPVFTDHRAILQRKLALERIYAPILWPIETQELVVNDTVRWIYDHALMLPCDQRYGVADMQRIIDVINRR